MPYTLLIAEDEDLEREALARLADDPRAGSPRVLLARSAGEALSLLETEVPDLAILDIRMPGGSGLDVAQRVREQRPAADIVFLSAFDRFDYAQAAVRVGALDYLVKPVNDDAVLRILQRSAERGRQYSDRFAEAARFLEDELLDDLIDGDVEPERAERAFSLLGIPEVRGTVLVVEPDFNAYPFALETASQRRTVVQRVLRVLGRQLQAHTDRCLIRAHARFGYLFLLGGEHAPDDVSVAAAAATTEKETAVGFRLHRSASFAGVAQLHPVIDSVHGALMNADGSAPPAELEERLLNSLVSGDAGQVRMLAGEVCDAALQRSVPADAAAELEGMLRHLSHVLRLRGGRGIRPGRWDGLTRRSELRGVFVGRVEELLRLQQGAGEPELKKRMREWVNRNFHRAVGLQDLADYVGLSSSHCSRRFAALFGETFVRYLRNRRITEARRLLGDPSLSVREVGERCGFEDAGYFARVFTQAEGLSPREFRGLGQS